MTESSDKRALTVLYVEDNAANTRLIAHLLRRHYDAVLLTATDGERGLELARSAHPDLILLDIGLPDMDGFEVLRRLRADEALRDTPVFAVSARAMPEHVKEGLEAGFQRYLTKPISIKELLESIDTVVGGNREQP